MINKHSPGQSVKFTYRGKEFIGTIQGVKEGKMDVRFFLLTPTFPNIYSKPMSQAERPRLCK